MWIIFFHFVLSRAIFSVRCSDAIFYYCFPWYRYFISHSFCMHRNIMLWKMTTYWLVSGWSWILSHQEYNLYQIIRERDRPFSEEQIRSFMSQVLQGLAHMHRNGYFHRDLKPGKLISSSIICIISISWFKISVHIFTEGFMDLDMAIS